MNKLEELEAEFDMLMLDNPHVPFTFEEAKEEIYFDKSENYDEEWNLHFVIGYITGLVGRQLTESELVELKLMYG